MIKIAQRIAQLKSHQQWEQTIAVETVPLVAATRHTTVSGQATHYIGLRSGQGQGRRQKPLERYTYNFWEVMSSYERTKCWNDYSQIGNRFIWVLFKFISTVVVYYIYSKIETALVSHTSTLYTKIFYTLRSIIQIIYF